MELNLETKQQLEKLLAKPTLATPSHIPFLQDLIQAYPYYQPLHLLLARASTGNENQQTAYTTASTYCPGHLLHAIIHEPQQLKTVEGVKVVVLPWPINDDIVIGHSSTGVEAEITPTATQLNEVENLSEQEQAPAPLITEEAEATTAPIADNNEIVEEYKAPATVPADFIVPEIENLAPLPNEVIPICEITPQESILTGTQETPDSTPPENEAVSAEADDQETFEEIGELIVPEVSKEELVFEHHLPPPSTTETATPQEETNLPETAVPHPTDIDTATNSPDFFAFDKEDDISVAPTTVADTTTESLTTKDFFVLDTDFQSIVAEEQPQESDYITETPILATDHGHISKYDDDKMPFSFLWWLAKTRKEHEQLFRPYVATQTNKVTTDGQNLHQQYVEHIFHLQTPVGQEIEEHITEKQRHSKGNELIDSFIKNDPQIKAPKPDQINNENKAKRSAEDNYDLVSETLAEIYIEQMLYHKAIDTYKKLSLKFPEKSRYFADLVQSLEKKI